VARCMETGSPAKGRVRRRRVSTEGGLGKAPEREAPKPQTSRTNDGLLCVFFSIGVALLV
jgi:hypothetical protein